MGKDVKVLGYWPSPFVMRPQIALHLKSIDYEFIEETAQPKSEFLLKSNLVYKKVPVLFHNDKPVCESLLIVEYIDEAFSSSPSILPSDAYDRAIQRFWGAYIDDKWFPSFQEVVHGTNEETRAAAIEKVKEGLELFEEAFTKCSKGMPFFSGDKLGYLDIVLGSFVGWLCVVAKMNNLQLLSLEKTPCLLAWADRFCAHDAVKDCMPKTEKLMDFAKLMKAKFEAFAAANTQS